MKSCLTLMSQRHVYSFGDEGHEPLMMRMYGVHGLDLKDEKSEVSSLRLLCSSRQDPCCDQCLAW